MTLSKHLVILRSGIVLSVLFITVLAVVSWYILPFYPQIEEGVQNRAVPGFLSALFPQTANPYIPFATLSAALLWALGSLIVTFYFFENTQSVEVNFFILFVLSFVFEILRISVPLYLAFNLPVVFLKASAHILMFCRYFGLLSLFIASLYAAGLSIEKEENVILPLFIITIFISIRIPVNIFTYDSSFCLVNSYPVTFRIVETVISALTTLSFFASAIKSGLKEYYFTGIGAFFVLTGRSLLIEGDTCILPATGLLLLCAGVYFITTCLRKIYLWI